MSHVILLTLCILLHEDAKGQMSLTRTMNWLHVLAAKRHFGSDKSQTTELEVDLIVHLTEHPLFITMASTDKLQTYAKHLTTALIPSLQNIRQEIARIDVDIKE